MSHKLPVSQLINSKDILFIFCVLPLMSSLIFYAWKKFCGLATPPKATISDLLALKNFLIKVGSKKTDAADEFSLFYVKLLLLIFLLKILITIQPDY